MGISKNVRNIKEAMVGMNSTREMRYPLTASEDLENFELWLVDSHDLRVLQDYPDLREVVA